MGEAKRKEAVRVGNRTELEGYIGVKSEGHLYIGKVVTDPERRAEVARMYGAGFTTLGDAYELLVQFGEGPGGTYGFNTIPAVIVPLKAGLHSITVRAGAIIDLEYSADDFTEQHAGFLQHLRREDSGIILPGTPDFRIPRG